jgi:hypothetical protein
MSKIYDALQHLEAQRQAMDRGETPAPSINLLDRQERPVPVAPSSDQHLLERAVAVTRFGDEVHRRLGEVGLDGVRGLFALADQLQRALAMVSQPELDIAEADLERVANQVHAMKEKLRQLRVVKADLEGLAGPPRR